MKLNYAGTVVESLGVCLALENAENSEDILGANTAPIGGVDLIGRELIRSTSSGSYLPNLVCSDST